jgi:hypothetical protein
MYRDKDNTAMKFCWYFRTVLVLLTIIEESSKGHTLLYEKVQSYGIGNGWPEKFHINATSQPHGLYMMPLNFQLEIQYY